MRANLQRVQLDFPTELVEQLDLVAEKRRAAFEPTKRARLIREAVAALVQSELGTLAPPANRAPPALTVRVTRPAVLAR